MLCLLFVVSFVSSIIAQDTCDPTDRKYIINPDAQAHIGAILSLRNAGQHGTGCGKLSTGAVQALEGMMWAMSLLNQDTGKIGDLSITDSYIPGIKLGKFTSPFAYIIYALNNHIKH